MEGLQNSVIASNVSNNTMGQTEWLVQIGHKYFSLNYLRDEDVWNKIIAQEQMEQTGGKGRLGIKIIMPAPGVPERTLYKLIEENPLQHFNYIEKECVENKFLMPKLASYLSGRALELICNKIFSKTKINEDFLEVFYLCFFSYFLQRPYTWFSLHLLIKASKAYPIQFKTNMKILLVNTNIKSCILQDYIQRLNKEDCTNLLKLYQDLHFTPEKFDHILPVTYLLCKNGEMTDNIFQLIYSKLEIYSDFCAHNPNYGKLLLHFVQNMSGRGVSMRDLKKLVKCHRTSYKRICKAALEKIHRDLEALQEDIYDGPRIVIPRPSDDFEM